jgi:NAD(P)-dependent dehydrogenase (short-subunit alcohol dehydrogenase family)
MSHRLFVVTGASRGIGKAVTKALASSSVFSDGKMHFVLTSTKQMDLDAAKASLEETVTKLYGNIDRLSVYLYPIDFSDMDNIESQLGHLFDLAPTPTSKWTQVVLMMNHGSLGGLDFIEDVSSKLSQV